MIHINRAKIPSHCECVPVAHEVTTDLNGAFILSIIIFHQKLFGYREQFIYFNAIESLVLQGSVLLFKFL